VEPGADGDGPTPHRGGCRSTVRDAQPVADRGVGQPVGSRCADPGGREGAAHRAPRHRHSPVDSVNEPTPTGEHHMSVNVQVVWGVFASMKPGKEKEFFGVGDKDLAEKMLPGFDDPEAVLVRRTTTTSVTYQVVAHD